MEILEVAYATRANLLITGPTGTGKTCLAREVHEQSGVRGPFVSINLATLHEGTLESELFGHHRGAFTGAFSDRKGRIEEADGGTLFLDEIGDLPLRLQARLLEVIQDKCLVRVGENLKRKFDFRIITATHRDLEKQVREGKFREDLFHRLRVLTLELKPLRERTDELDQWVHRFLEELSRRQSKPILRISESVAEILEAHSWPGNLRELWNVLEFSTCVASGRKIEKKHLPPWFLRSPSYLGDTVDAIEVPFQLDYHQTLCRFEKLYLSRALDHFKGKINQTSRALGLSKATLNRRIRAYGLVY